MPMQADPHSLQWDHSLLPEVDTLLFNPSFQLKSAQQESLFNVADLLASLPATHGILDPSLMEGLSPHDTLGPMDPFPDDMDWLTPASEAYLESPTLYEYKGPPAFTWDNHSLFMSEGWVD